MVDPTSGKTTSTPTYKGFVPCGNGATQLQKAYGVDQVVKGGVDGTGQTVAIVDAYGSPTILQDADPYTGANVFITDESAGDTSPEIEPYGGTSVACPLFAGLLALVDQARAKNGLAPIGLDSQYLYSLPASALHDVTNPPADAGNANPDGAPRTFALYYGPPYLLVQPNDVISRPSTRWSRR